MSAEWELALGENAALIQAEWLHTIGNLTLTGYNPELGNQSFSEKQKVFAQSHFELNRYFANLTLWCDDQIRQRSQDLFRTALALWPRPASMSEEESPTDQRPQPANFHSACVRAAEKAVGFAVSNYLEQGIRQEMIERDLSAPFLRSTRRGAKILIFGSLCTWIS